MLGDNNPIRVFLKCGIGTKATEIVVIATETGHSTSMIPLQA
jgi:hypothetical protein